LSSAVRVRAAVQVGKQLHAGALATVVLLWRFRKLQEPVVIAAAALAGLLLYPLVHA
jgi:hypothetical protein